MKRRTLAAAAYVAIVFSVAFIMGVVRTLFVAPITGDVSAVLIETPIILLVSWLAAGWCIRRFSIPAKTAARLTMGFAAFALLMAIETTMSLVLFSRPLAEQAEALATPAGAIGLLAQVAFALMPLLAARGR